MLGACEVVASLVRSRSTGVVRIWVAVGVVVSVQGFSGQ